MRTCYNYNKYIKEPFPAVRFSGTSSAAAVSGGVMALLLESNPSLTWRDVQHVIIRGSDPDRLEQNADWNTNAVGRK